MKVAAFKVGAHGEVGPGVAIFTAVNGVKLIGVSGEEDIDAIGLRFKGDDFGFGSLLWLVLGLQGSESESGEQDDLFEGHWIDIFAYLLHRGVRR